MKEKEFQYRLSTMQDEYDNLKSFAGIKEKEYIKFLREMYDVEEDLK